MRACAPQCTIRSADFACRCFYKLSLELVVESLWPTVLRHNYDFG